ncbi:MAG: hypothetical protein ACI9XZ_003775 [Alphaproteobacteria bacterium]|jgi:hypothetical protein
MRPKLIAALVLSLCTVTTSEAYANDDSMASMHGQRVERNKICFDGHTHTGGAEGKTKRAAHRAAIREWRSFTAWEYGSTWSSYKRASGKTVSYSKAEVGWLARVEARPCRLKSRRKRRSRRR